MPVAQVGDDRCVRCPSQLPGRLCPARITIDAHWLSRCRTIGAWYLGIPPITRALLTTYLITGLGFMIGVVPLKYMYLDWGLVSPLRLLRSRQSPEVCAPGARSECGPPRRRAQASCSVRGPAALVALPLALPSCAALDPPALSLASRPALRSSGAW